MKLFNLIRNNKINTAIILFSIYLLVASLFFSVLFSLFLLAVLVGINPEPFKEIIDVPSFKLGRIEYVNNGVFNKYLTENSVGFRLTPLLVLLSVIILLLSISNDTAYEVHSQKESIITVDLNGKSTSTLIVKVTDSFIRDMLKYAFLVPLENYVSKDVSLRNTKIKLTVRTACNVSSGRFRHKENDLITDYIGNNIDERLIDVSGENYVAIYCSDNIKALQLLTQ